MDLNGGDVFFSVRPLADLIELPFSLRNEGKEGKNLGSQTWPDIRDHPIFDTQMPWSSFPWCLGKNQGKPPQTPRIFYPLGTLENSYKNSEKMAENTWHTKEFLWLEKTKEKQNTKEKKIRVMRRWRNEHWFWHNKKWFEGRHVCHLCDARARTRLPHKCHAANYYCRGALLFVVFLVPQGPLGPQEGTRRTNNTTRSKLMIYCT